MSRPVIALAAASLIVLATPAFAGSEPKAAKGGKEATVAAKPLKAGEKDANVKNPDAKNDKNSAADAPPNKGGKARGQGPWGCRIVVDNWTAYVVKTFVDGDFVGTVGRFGDGGMNIGNGATLLYARAEFDDGTSWTWGPTAVECPAGGRYIWKIVP